MHEGSHPLLVSPAPCLQSLHLRATQSSLARITANWSDPLGVRAVLRTSSSPAKSRDAKCSCERVTGQAELVRHRWISKSRKLQLPASARILLNDKYLYFCQGHFRIKAKTCCSLRKAFCANTCSTNVTLPPPSSKNNTYCKIAKQVLLAPPRFTIPSVLIHRSTE